MARITLVGEGMVELSRPGAEGWRLGYGGDTLNTAIHLARLGDDVLRSVTVADDHLAAERGDGRLLVGVGGEGMGGVDLEDGGMHGGDRKGGCCGVEGKGGGTRTRS